MDYNQLLKYTQVLIISFCLVIGLSACASENTVMIGIVNQDKLMTDSNFVLDISKGVLSDEELIQIKHWPDDLHIDIYFGTWCHDSQREVPKIIIV